ncbi:MAG TPA: hypothetical protein VFZ31_16715 [Vicinamibacterales bacterium]
MDSITVQYLIAILGIGLGLAGLLLPEPYNPLKMKGDYAKHVSPGENMKLARIFGAVMLATGLLIGFATMAFGDLDLL